MYLQEWHFALCMDKRISDLTKLALRGKVYGVYHKCFSILTEDGRLISIFGRMPYQLPMAIMTDLAADAPFADIEILSGQSVLFDAGQMLIEGDGLRIDLRKAAQKETQREKMNGIDTKALFNTARAMAKKLARTGKQLGEGRWIEQWSAYILEKVPLSGDSIILPRVAELLDSIVNGDAEKMESALMKLVGLGIGLTPSADDMICGLAHSFYMFGNEERTDVFLKTLESFLSKYGMERTTLVSLQQLKQSTGGIMSEQIFLLLDSLSQDDISDGLRESICRVVDYGSSSGTELCMGILAGCSVLNDILQGR